MNSPKVNQGLKPSGRYMLVVILAVFFVFFVVTAVSFAQIAHTGMVDGHNLHERALNTQLRMRSVPARRGDILDRDGRLLSSQHPAYTIFANFVPDWGPAVDVDNLEETAYLLAQVINMSEEDILANLEFNVAIGSLQSWFGHAGQRLTFSQRLLIEELGIVGIGFVDELVRFHHQGTFASHTIGYTKFGDEEHNYGQLIGAMGLEDYFNDYLTGTDGLYQIQQDWSGIAQPGTERLYITPPRNGYDIMLTISTSIQVFLETAIASLVETNAPESVTAIVMHARTGEILAAASYPTFNPNHRNPLGYANTIMYRFEPGSTFKIFTYAAAINEGNYRGDETYYSGYRVLHAYPADDIIVRDHWLIPPRLRTFDEGFFVSTNTSTIDLVRNQLGLWRFVEYLEAFGFGVPTGLPLPGEHAGGLPNPSLSTVDVYMSSFGQYVTVTPIQLLQATTAILNDGEMVRPQLIRQIFDPNTNQVVQLFEREVIGNPITAETARQMRALMAGVIEHEEGTGRVHYLLEVPSGGKTGTAEVFNPITGLYHYNVHIYNYIGFAPLDDPEIIMFVAVENPVTTGLSGHPYAGQIYRFVMNNTLRYLGLLDLQTPDEDIDVPEFQLATVPNTLNLLVEDAIAAIEATGLTPFLIGDGTTVFNQLPLTNTTVQLGDKVFVQTGTTAELPDFTGWTRTQINQFGQLLDLDIRVNGVGVAVHQSLRAGRRVQAGDVIIVNLE